ncbi:hypothetical protein ES319_A12G124100v1 [Gossypium barbadense]|uniref:Uncharacterized protein n=1 Tax=Gossypium barbadense TaxID=3634 RepID=A0A5J5TCR4_GOSBA|nr:hypothetical protein ES319_A12G124100v1 [Gossypium barbadense]
MVNGFYRAPATVTSHLDCKAMPCSFYISEKPFIQHQPHEGSNLLRALKLPHTFPPIISNGNRKRHHLT